MKLGAIRLVTAACLILPITTAVCLAADPLIVRVSRTVNATVHPLMVKDRIPGMAVGLIVDGKPYLFNFGVASMETRQPVTCDTLFELGSVSKTLTATLASYAQVNGYLSLYDKVDKYLPVLRGSGFGDVSLLSLGTHTPGGLPLQVPDAVHNNDDLLQYLTEWRPTYAQGTYRTYSNLSIGMLGLIVAESMHRDFTTLMEQQLFPALGMEDSYFKVPEARMADYAQGYTKDGAPIQMATGVLSSEAYGIKTTATDMVRFVEANMDLVKLDDKVRRAIADTHIGYFEALAMTQDLIWEQYQYPVALKTLLDGNSYAMISHATPVTEIRPPRRPQADAWIDKTGSTNGFGVYVAFVPKQRLGIVILANKNFSIHDRVTAAYDIFTALGQQPAVKRDGQGPDAARHEVR